MAIVKVIKPVPGWNVGDQVEAFDERLNELVSAGIVEVLVLDVKSEVKIEVEIPVEEPKVEVKKSKKKGG